MVISLFYRIFAVDMRHKIYVASSWRNEYYPEVMEELREAGHDVYDFRNPPSGDPGFKWKYVSAPSKREEACTAQYIAGSVITLLSIKHRD